MGQDETKKLSFRASLLTGVAIFSMFFGAGNLILPPLMGYKAGVAIVPAFIGYGLSGVVLPIMALASIARSGNMKALTSRISPWFSKIFILCLYVTIGPGLAMPRTATTAFEMMSPVFSLQDSQVALFVFSLVFSQ